MGVYNMTIRKEFDHALDELKDLLIEMGHRVEKALDLSIQSLKNQDLQLANTIIHQDREINSLEDKIIEVGSKLVATQQPVAKDLRRILVAFKISSDLERMADLAVDIAKVTLRIGAEPLFKPLLDIPRMAEITQKMIQDSIQCYVREDIDLAFKMAKQDDEVDHLHSQILREMFSYIVENPKNVNQSMLLIFVCRYLERIADHATNIGEHVVYLVIGKRPELNS
jgi:phosphate transport system protein